MSASSDIPRGTNSQKEAAPAAHFLLTALVAVGAFSTAQAEIIDFESVPDNILLSTEFASLGVIFSGAGAFSGLVLTEGDFNTANFGNSPTQFVHAGRRDEPTTITFVDPANPSIVIGATAVSLLLGDGNPDLETFEVTYRDVAGVVLQGPTEHTTMTQGLFLLETEATLGSPIGSLEIRLVPSSLSGVVFDDLEFFLNRSVPALSTWALALLASLLIGTTAAWARIKPQLFRRPNDSH